MEEKVKLIKCLLHRHEGLSSGPQHPHKIQGQYVTLAQDTGAGHRNKRFLGAHWPAGVAELISRFSEKACLRTGRWEVMGGAWCWPLAFAQRHTHVCTCTHMHMYIIHINTYIPHTHTHTPLNLDGFFAFSALSFNFCVLQFSHPHRCGNYTGCVWSLYHSHVQSLSFLVLRDSQYFVSCVYVFSAPLSVFF